MTIVQNNAIVEGKEVIYIPQSSSFYDMFYPGNLIGKKRFSMCDLILF